MLATRCAAVLRGRARNPASQFSVRQHQLSDAVLPEKNVSTPCRHEPICSHVVDFLASPLDSSQQGTPRIGLYLPPQNHAKRRILCQYTICRNPACLIDLTAIPDGHCRNSVGPDRRNLHFLRDPGTRHPYIHVTVTNLVALWIGECFSCGDGQYQ